MTNSDGLRQIVSAGIVAIIRGQFPLKTIEEIGDALFRGGITAIEVTLNSANALKGIAALSNRLGDEVTIGAGTVMTPEQVDAATAAGARYFLAPNLDEKCIERAATHGLPFIPSVFTSTEIAHALSLGCRLLKLFPASIVGPGYLTAMRGPFQDAKFVVTGGIGLNELGAFHVAGAAAFGIGSTLVREGKTHEEIAAEAHKLVAELARLRATDSDGAQ